MFNNFYNRIQNLRTRSNRILQDLIRNSPSESDDIISISSDSVSVSDEIISISSDSEEDQITQPTKRRRLNQDQEQPIYELQEDDVISINDSESNLSSIGKRVRINLDSDSEEILQLTESDISQQYQEIEAQLLQELDGPYEEEKIDPRLNQDTDSSFNVSHVAEIQQQLTETDDERLNQEYEDLVTEVFPDYGDLGKYEYYTEEEIKYVIDRINILQLKIEEQCFSNGHFYPNVRLEYLETLETFLQEHLDRLQEDPNYISNRYAQAVQDLQDAQDLNGQSYDDINLDQYDFDFFQFETPQVKIDLVLQTCETQDQNNLQDAFPCPICCEEDKQKDVIKTVCKHMFHKDCFIECIKRNVKCPICRREF